MKKCSKCGIKLSDNFKFNLCAICTAKLYRDLTRPKRMFMELGYTIKLEYGYQRYISMNGPRSRQQYLDYRTWMNRCCE